MSDALVTLGLSTASAVFVLFTLYWFITTVLATIRFV